MQGSFAIQLLNMLRKNRIIFILFLSIALLFFIPKKKSVIYKNSGIFHIKGNIYVRYYFSGNAKILGFRGDTIVNPIAHNDYLYYFAEDRFLNIDSLLIKGDYVKIIDYGSDNKYLKYIKDHIVVFPFLILIFFIKNRLKYGVSIFITFVSLIVFNTLFVKFHFIGLFNVLLYLFNVFIVFLVLYYFYPENQLFVYKRERKDLIFLLLGLFYGIIYIYLYISPDNIPFMRDMYHIGEVMMQWSLLQKGLPYKDVFIIHGLFQDPYQVSLGFLLFGKHISSYFIMSTVMVIVTSILFIYLAWMNMDYYRFRWFVLIFFVYGFFSFMITDRILPVVLFLIIYSIKTDWIEYLVFMVFFGFLYSVDVGIILLILYLVLFIISIKNIRWLLFVMSFILSFIMFLCIIRFQLICFLKYLVYILKDYGKEWFFPYSFPWIKNVTIYTLLPVFIHGVGLYYIIKGIIKKEISIIAILLYVGGFLFFYGAINRSDYASIGGGIILSVMAIFIMMKNRDEVIIWSLFIMLLLSLPSHSLYEGLKGRMFYNSLKIIKEIKGIDDEKLLPYQYKEALNYIKYKSQGSVYVFSSEGIWYYFLNTSPYTLYMLPVTAVSKKEQERVVKDMDYGKIKYIIYDRNSWFFEPNKKRIITDYIMREYIMDTVFDSIEIMVRRKR